jgi:hypothetical protein
MDQAALGPLACLVGTFAGEGRGQWAAPAPFVYRERLEFTCPGKPLLSYRQQATTLDGQLSHTECGFLRLGSEPGSIEWMIAQPTGITEIQVGRFEGTVAVCEASTIGLAPTAKTVTAMRRRLELDGDELRYELQIAMNGEPLAPHLIGELRRVG